MKKNQRLLAGIVMSVSFLAFAQERGSSVKLTGWVIDSACAYTKGLEGKPEAIQMDE